MPKIIYCSDLILRIDDHQEVNNVTEFFETYSEFTPSYPHDCVVRSEVSSMGKLGVIMGVWGALIVLTTIYCYFCEQRLFPNQKLADKFPNGCVGCERASSTVSSSPLSTPKHRTSPPSSPSLQNLSSSLSNVDIFKSPSITSQSSLLSSSVSCTNTKMKEQPTNPNSRYAQSNTNAYRRICHSISPRTYDYSSLPSSPTTLTSMDIMASFVGTAASTNSDELLLAGNAVVRGPFDQSELPSQTKSGLTQPLNSTKSHKIEENLIQLEDSPKHSLRSRKTASIKSDLMALDPGLYNTFRFEDENCTNNVEPAVATKCKGNLQNFCNDKFPWSSCTKSNISPGMVDNINQAISSNYTSGLSASLNTVDAQYQDNTLIQNNQTPSKMKTRPELSFANSTAVFQSFVSKDKVV